jgi:hypothetical protein
VITVVVPVQTLKEFRKRIHKRPALKERALERKRHLFLNNLDSDSAERFVMTYKIPKLGTYGKQKNRELRVCF